MLPFEEARGRVIAAASLLEDEEIAIDDAVNRVLSEDLVSATPLPAFDYSAMDGYAVSSDSLTGPPPYELPVIGESRAGGERPKLEPGAAVRIFTGAELPDGADAVVIQEDTSFADERVRFEICVSRFDNVRRQGEDLPAGTIALGRGTRLGPFQVGLAAALDRATLRVIRRARVVLATTGDELRAPGTPAERGKVPDSNRVAIRALAEHAGASVLGSVHTPDDVDVATRLFADFSGDCDVLVTLGGVSVGKHDIVRAALTAAGAELGFWKVAIKPGKPFTFGRLGRALVLGLPGNPVSAQVTFALFGIPLLRTLHGERNPLPKLERTVLANGIRQRAGRLGVYRARLDGGRATLAANQASGSTLSLAHADALLFVPADVTELGAGSEVDALRLSEL